MREMQALGYHLGAIDTQNRLEKYNEFKAQLPDEQREFLDSTVGKYGMVPLWNKLPRIHLLFALSLLLSSWGTSIVQRPLLLVMVEAEVLAVVGVKG